MKESICATAWFSFCGIVCAGYMQGIDLPLDVKFISFLLVWAVTGAAPPAFYKLMRQWFD